MMRDGLRCGPIPCRSDKLSRFTARMVPGSTASVRRPLEGQPPPEYSPRRTSNLVEPWAGEPSHHGQRVGRMPRLGASGASPVLVSLMNAPLRQAHRKYECAHRSFALHCAMSNLGWLCLQ